MSSGKIDFVVQAQQQLARCDSCKTFEELQKTFDAGFMPLLHGLLHLPLANPLTMTAAPSSCVHEAIVQFRKEMVEAFDDVYYMVLVAASKLVKEEARVAKGGAARTSRKRGRDEPAPPAAATGSTEEFTANVYTCLYGREMPNTENMSLRWKFLAAEKEKVLQSNAYVNSNAQERKGMHLHTVLSVFSLKAHRHAFTALWTGLFSLKLHPSLHQHLLTGIGQNLMPHLTNPLTLSDYLTDCFRKGGLTAVLALEGIFVLMVDHGLEYPEFYNQLYSLLDPNCFSTRYRNQLFRLVDASMKSLMVPAYVAAAFIKRTARVALVSPTPVLYFAMPFIRQLLQRHPNCIAMIHRSRKDLQAMLAGKKTQLQLELESDTKQAEADEQEAAEESEGEGSESSGDAAGGEDTAAEPIDADRAARLTKLFQGVDPFDPKEKDTSKCNAIDSSLWELCLLERHFMPAVRLMVSAYTSPAEDTTALRFDKTYDRLFAHELTRKSRGKPMVNENAFLDWPFTNKETDGCMVGVLTLGKPKPQSASAEAATATSAKKSKVATKK